MYIYCVTITIINCRSQIRELQQILKFKSNPLYALRINTLPTQCSSLLHRKLIVIGLLAPPSRVFL